MTELQRADTKEEMQLVAFKLGNEEYAVDILAVQEIIRWTNITRVPKAPSYIKGVINLRGTVIPIIDSHLRFKLPQGSVTDSSRIIVFQLDNVAIGMTVDVVTEVLRLTPEQMEKAQSVAAVDNQFIKGIGKLGDRLLIVLDLPKTLGLEEERQRG